jgi:transposase
MKKVLEIIHPQAAGIDIGSKNFFVDAGEDEVKISPTYTEGCHNLRDYLKSQNITTVAMESTGVYWVILYGVLEDVGIEVFLVNGRDVKNVPGRKSDIKDCQWLRQLHCYGLLKKSFIPKDHIRKLRSYMRLRQDHIRAQATQTHLMQKALTLMNIRLTEVLNDIMGVSGSKMIYEILKGERDPNRLVEYCHVSILNTKKELVIKSLEGEYREEHLFALQHAYQTWHYYQNLLLECDKKIEEILQKMTIDKSEPIDIGKRKPIRYHKPNIKSLTSYLLKLTNGKDPTGIAGITDYSFLQIISEIGTDMSSWESEKHFVSWLKLSPLKSSSGKFSKRITVKRTNKSSLIFRNIAQGIINSKYLALGIFGRRIKAKRGSGVAIKAIARKIALFYYRVMTKGEEFLEIGVKMYEAQQEAQKKRFLTKMAKNMNMQLIPVI